MNEEYMNVSNSGPSLRHVVLVLAGTRARITASVGVGVGMIDTHQVKSVHKLGTHTELPRCRTLRQR